MKINKEWFRVVAFFVALWLIIDAMYISLMLNINSEIYGQTEFWPAMLWSFVIDLIAMSSIVLIIYLIVSLIKTVRKGLKEEKNEDRHRKNNR